ncbi:hypothetical protein FBU30_002829, partial [Linnemannia zychae]
MSPAQKLELRQRYLVKEHLETRTARGYRDEPLSQISETQLCVESFKDPKKTYLVDFKFDQSGETYVTGCSCEFFKEYMMCCHHISLALYKIPYTTFLRLDQYEYESKLDPSMLEPAPGLSLSDSDKSRHAQELFPHILERAMQLESLRDKNFAHPHMVEMVEHMQTMLQLFEHGLRLQDGNRIECKRPAKILASRLIR